MQFFSSTNKESYNNMLRENVYDFLAHSPLSINPDKNVSDKSLKKKSENSSLLAKYTRIRTHTQTSKHNSK